MNHFKNIISDILKDTNSYDPWHLENVPIDPIMVDNIYTSILRLELGTYYEDEQLPYLHIEVYEKLFVDGHFNTFSFILTAKARHRIKIVFKAWEAICEDSDSINIISEQLN